MEIVKNYSVKKYQKSDYLAWNAFIGQAKNATFLFHRDFMEYHEDRFEDFSLLIYNEQKLVAVLPTNRVGDTVYSHQGLTYGGLVYGQKLKLTHVLEVFRSVLAFLNKKGILQLQINLLPSFYAIAHSEEINYALFLAQAKLFRRDTCAVIDLQKKFLIAKGRMQGVAKARNNNLVIKEEGAFDAFWNEILIPNLSENYQVKPVHSLEEIQYLHQKFPNNIRQFNVYHENKIVAGTTIFETKNVAHAQYISGNFDKSTLGSVDFVYYNLVTKVFKNKAYLDFGISNLNQGRNLNQGLSYWKESFGANIVVQDFYEVSTANFYYLDNIIV